MEENVISMFMDVKLDIRERKLEFSHLKSWTRYFVRVEAVKCFPCYIKISFFKAHTDETTDLIVRINIPGLTVQMATSRTRSHLYGLFWKHNRKRCCAYFALPSQLLCERHLHWMKKSIRNLELYRQEILQLRRVSRTPMHEFQQDVQPSPCGIELGVYQNLDFTQNMADVHDILGPLPKVPDHHQWQSNVSKRESGVSGIYEEIFDPSRASGGMRNISRASRASIASGIYEEMKLADIVEQAEKSIAESAEDDGDAPPLPPRPRSHTNEFELQRSFTNPESDYLKKKKHWLLFESMFGRKRTTSGGSASIGNNGPKKVEGPPGANKIKEPSSSQEPKVVYRDKIARLRFTESKRNSFSSPDLSLLKVDGGSNGKASDNLSDEGSCSSEFYVQHEVDYIEEDCFPSSEFLNVSQCSSIEESLANLFVTGEEKGDDETRRRMNVSDRVVPDFNSSCNMSTVNLVGFNCMMLKRDIAPLPVLAPPEGYCEMGAPGTGFNRQKLQDVEVRSKVTGEPNIEECLYMNMESKATEKEEASRSSSTSSGVSSIYSNRSSVCSMGKHRNSIDDKVASYYPNEDYGAVKNDDVYSLVKKSPKSKEGSTKKSTPKRLENHYVTSPKSSHRRGSPQGTSTLPRVSKSAQKPPCSKVRTTGRSISSERRSLSKSPPRVAELSPAKTSILQEATTPPYHQKYATIARGMSISPSKYQEKNSVKKPPEQAPVGGSKRFGSLPRFAKIDLSPLRLKINSVLQRHSQENL